MWFKDENIMLNLSKSNVDMLGVIKNEDETCYVMCCFTGLGHEGYPLVDNLTFDKAEKFIEKLILLVNLEEHLINCKDDFRLLKQEYGDEIDMLYSSDVDAKTILQYVDPIGFDNGEYNEI